MDILELIQEAWKYIKHIYTKIINRIINFFNDVVTWFKSLRLRQGRDVPFLADPEKFRDLLHKAPVKPVGIFKGVYNEETNEITYNEYLQADEMDEQTRNILDQEALVVLS